jgi:hypothetical protein
MRPDASAAETPLIDVDELMTKRRGVRHRRRRSCTITGSWSHFTSSASGNRSCPLGVIVDSESVDAAVTVVISVFAGVVDALTTKSSRILVP